MPYPPSPWAFPARIVRRRPGPPPRSNGSGKHGQPVRQQPQAEREQDGPHRIVAPMAERGRLAGHSLVMEPRDIQVAKSQERSHREPEGEVRFREEVLPGLWRSPRRPEEAGIG